MVTSAQYLKSLKTLHNGGKNNDVDSNQQSFGAKDIIRVIRNQSAFKLIAKAFEITVAVKIKLSVWYTQSYVDNI